MMKKTYHNMPLTMEFLWLHFLAFVKNVQNPMLTWNPRLYCVASVAHPTLWILFEPVEVILSTPESKVGDFTKTRGENLDNVSEGGDLLLVEP